MSPLPRIAEFVRPTMLDASFNVISYAYEDAVLFAVTRGDLKQPGVTVRIQSPCLFGESFGVNSCDCGEQLRMSLREGANKGETEGFLLVYLSHQEGRSHGMAVKVKAVDLEANQNREMTEAFRILNLELDLREYEPAVAIIKELVGENPIRLLTNNPKKVAALEAHGIKVDRLPLVVESPGPECRRYMNSKRRDMGHVLPDFEL